MYGAEVLVSGDVISDAPGQIDVGLDRYRANDTGGSLINRLEIVEIDFNRGAAA
jgi:hypothetical protein